MEAKVVTEATEAPPTSSWAVVSYRAVTKDRIIPAVNSAKDPDVHARLTDQLAVMTLLNKDARNSQISVVSVVTEATAVLPPWLWEADARSVRIDRTDRTDHDHIRQRRLQFPLRLQSQRRLLSQNPIQLRFQNQNRRRFQLQNRPQPQSRLQMLSQRHNVNARAENKFENDTR